MKLLITFIIFLAGIACYKSKPALKIFDNQKNSTPNNIVMGNKITIKTGDRIFTATLADNAAAMAFRKLLPMTVSMTELNGNEKYCDLTNILPASALKPGTISNGDLMLWGSETVVLFYKTFSAPYSYTRLGKVDDPEGLAAALGNGNVTVTFTAD